MDFRWLRARLRTTMALTQTTASDTRNSGIWMCSAISGSWAFRSIWTTRALKELGSMLSRSRTARQRDYASRTCNLLIGRHPRPIRYCIPEQSEYEDGWDAGFRQVERINSRNQSTMRRPFRAEAVAALWRRM